MTKKKVTKEKPQKSDDKKPAIQAEQNQAIINALDTVMQVSKSHSSRIHNLESKLEGIMGKLGQVLTRMGL